MLGTQLGKGATKWAISTQPFIDDNCQGILVTGGAGLALDLLGSHVGNGTNYILRALETRALGNEGDAKIAQQDFVAPSH